MSYLEYVTLDSTSEDPMPELARTNRFSMEDLARNREGKISESQRTKLFSRALRPLRYPLGALIGWLIAVVIIKTLIPGFILGIISMMGGKSVTAAAVVITAGCVLATLVAAMQSSRLIALLIADLSAGKADFLDGRLSVSKEEDNGLGLDKFHSQKVMRCAYVIKGEYFAVDEEAAAAAPQGNQYRLYFTPKSKLLLSLEPVPNKS